MRATKSEARRGLQRALRLTMLLSSLASVCHSLHGCASATSADVLDVPADIAEEPRADVAPPDVAPPDVAPPDVLVDVPDDVRDEPLDAVGPEPGPEAGPRDGALPDVIAGGPTYTFVASALLVDPNDAVEVPHTGFNVDALFSGPLDADGCHHEDFFSSLDGDQHRPTGCMVGSVGCVGGVDNQLPTVVAAVAAVTGGDPRAILASEVANNRFALLIQLSGVDDPVNDPAIGIRVFVGYPTFSTGCMSVLADREYSIATDSLRPGGVGATAALVALPGSIVRGRVVTSSPGSTGLPFPLPIGPGLSFSVTLNAVQVRFDVNSTLDLGLRGNLGGWAPGNDLVDSIITIVPEFRSAVEAILAGVVDVRLPGMTLCADRSSPMMPRFGGVSMGLGFQLLRARISPTTPVAAVPAVGTCGAI